MTIFGPLSLSFAPYVKSSRTLSKWITPFAQWYVNVAGYRKVGLRYDDLLVEERPDVQRALTRLTPREHYDRAWRIKQASQASVKHINLEKEHWLKPEDDIRYLKPHVEDVVAEDMERAKWDSVAVTRARH